MNSPNPGPSHGFFVQAMDDLQWVVVLILGRNDWGGGGMFRAIEPYHDLQESIQAAICGMSSGHRGHDIHL